MKNDSELQKAIASRMGIARRNAGLSQGQVANQLEMHRPTISEIEAGRRKVTAGELSRFSALYGVDIGWLSCSDSTQVDANRDRLELAARELSKLKKSDLDKVIELLSALRPSEPDK
jgi:transcriptional regulator with XRE-family HTH domain